MGIGRIAFILVITGAGAALTASAAIAAASTALAYDSWTTYAPEGVDEEAVYRQTAAGAVIDVPGDAPVDWYRYSQDIKDIAVGEVYELTALVKTEGQRDGVGALISLSGVDADGERLMALDSERAKGHQDWSRLRTVFFIPDNIAALRVQLYLHGRGRVLFDDVRFRRIEKLISGGGKEIALGIGAAKKESLIGFGLQDDAFFFTEENYRHGVDDADIALREKRIAALDPSIICTLLWWEAFNPARDLETITHDTEQMRALYRMLDVHQAAGRPVIIADVHWGWSKEQFPYNDKNVERGVDCYVDLLEHVIREKGYTCIQIASITGEPDLVFERSGGSFDSYVAAYRVMRKELAARGLGGIRLIGDKTSGTVWFQRAIKQAGDCFGLLAVHEYPDITQYPIVAHRLETAWDAIREGYGARETQQAIPPAFVWEIGFFDRAAGDTDNNQSAVKKYSYGLLCYNTCNLALNDGFGGGSVWCLHSMYYPGQNRMDFGFWEFKDRGWQIRPFYYGYGLYTRFLRPGMKVRALSMNPKCYDVSAAALQGDGGEQRLFVTNLSAATIACRIDGLPDRDYVRYEYTERRIPAKGDPHYGSLEALRAEETWRPGTSPLVVPSKTLVLLK